jgi:hypothetical protein
MNGDNLSSSSFNNAYIIISNVAWGMYDYYQFIIIDEQ